MDNFKPIACEINVYGEWSHPQMDGAIDKVVPHIPRKRINDGEYYRAQFCIAFNEIYPTLTLNVVVIDTRNVELNPQDRAGLAVNELKLAVDQHIVYVSTFYGSTFIWFVTAINTGSTLRSFTLHDCLL